MAVRKATITDKYNNTMAAEPVDVGGDILYYMPGLKHFNSIFPKLNEFQSRSEDVWICSYPKAGSNWAHEILCLLLHGRPSNTLKGDFMMERWNSIGDADGMASPRILNTHIPLKYLPQQIQESKIIHIIRNPLSVALSWYHHAKGMQENYMYSGSAEQFIESFSVTMYSLLGSWFEHVIDAYRMSQSDSNMLLMFYEEMLENPEKAIRELSEFIGSDVTEDIIENTVKQTSLKNMKDRFSSSSHALGQGVSGTVFTRKGEAAEWKKHVSQEFLTGFMQTYNRELKDYPELIKRIKI